MVKVKFVDVENDKPLTNTGFYVQFNPEQMKVKEKGINVQRGLSNASLKDEANLSSTLQHEASNMVSLSLHLLFNSLTSFEHNENKDVRGAIQNFYKYSDPSDKMPKKIGVIYGTMAVVGYITSLDVTYTAFDSQGMALRAEVDITIEGHHHGKIATTTLQQERNFQKESSSFAQSLKTFGDAQHWKAYASKHNVKDPLHK